MKAGAGSRLRLAVEAMWYRGGLPSALLFPFSLVYRLAVYTRRQCYRQGLLAVVAAPVPVIVVGNITVGGTGKTPVVIWLAEHLGRMGWRPGVISRGHGRRNLHATLAVATDSDPAMVGDEPLLIAQRTGCPVLVSRDRVLAARMLFEQWQCNIVISDDGLQHYRLHRDIELCMVDAAAGYHCLPAGPLREPPARLQEADLLLSVQQASSQRHAAGADSQATQHTPTSAVTADSQKPGMPKRHTEALGADASHTQEAQEPSHHYPVVLEATCLRNLRSAEPDAPLASWAGRTVHAVAGIARPERFFALLEAYGLHPIRHPFPDHHAYQPGDIDFADDLPVVMTEKDAVKCMAIGSRQHWRLPVCARPSEALVRQLDRLLKERCPKPAEG